jgi:CARDB protein
MRHRAHVLAAAILALVLVSVAGAARGDAIFATISGPNALAPGQVAAFNATVSGSGGAVLDYSWYITGANITGGSPLQTTPGHFEGNRTVVRLNITAPQVEGTFTIHLTAAPKPSAGGTPQNVTAQRDVIVIRAIVLSATFHNTAPTQAHNVTVNFYVDNGLVGSSVIKQIAANSDATATFNFLPVGLAPGSHTVRVQASLLGAQVTTYTVFYKDVTPPSTSLSVLIAIGVFVPVFIVTVGLRRRKK